MRGSVFAGKKERQYVRIDVSIRNAGGWLSRGAQHGLQQILWNTGLSFQVHVRAINYILDVRSNFPERPV